MKYVTQVLIILGLGHFLVALGGCGAPVDITRSVSDLPCPFMPGNRLALRVDAQLWSDGGVFFGGESNIQGVANNEQASGTSGDDRHVSGMLRRGTELEVRRVLVTDLVTHQMCRVNLMIVSGDYEGRSAYIWMDYGGPGQYLWGDYDRKKRCSKHFAVVKGWTCTQPE